MDGFYNGVQRYNADNAASVAVLGWDPRQPTQGLFTGSFDSVADTRVMAKGLVDQGADIVLPVAGSASVGAANLASKLGPGRLMVIGTESDQFEADAANKGVYLTSVLSNADVTTFKAIATVVDGSFQGGVIDGTLANGGVGLAPYHDLAAVVPQQLQDQLTTVTAGIVDGSIDVLASA
jgi:basic membrane protein A